MADFYDWDIKAVEVNFMLNPIGKGYSEGGGIQIAFEQPIFTTKNGADGNMIRQRTNYKGAKVTLTLHALSEVNTLLAGIAALEDASVGAGTGPFVATNTLGLATVAATSAWITKRPDVDAKAEVPDLVWEIQLANVTQFIGGT